MTPPSGSIELGQVGQFVQIGFHSLAVLTASG